MLTSPQCLQQQQSHPEGWLVIAQVTAVLKIHIWALMTTIKVSVAMYQLLIL